LRGGDEIERNGDSVGMGHTVAPKGSESEKGRNVQIR